MGLSTRLAVGIKKIKLLRVLGTNLLITLRVTSPIAATENLSPGL
jgi:hypothetical protein